MPPMKRTLDLYAHKQFSRMGGFFLFQTILFFVWFAVSFVEFFSAFAQDIPSRYIYAMLESLLYGSWLVALAIRKKWGLKFIRYSFVCLSLFNIISFFICLAYEDYTTAASDFAKVVLTSLQTLYNFKSQRAVYYFNCNDESEKSCGFNRMFGAESYHSKHNAMTLYHMIETETKFYVDEHLAKYSLSTIELAQLMMFDVFNFYLVVAYAATKDKKLISKVRKIRALLINMLNYSKDMQLISNFGFDEWKEYADKCFKQQNDFDKTIFCLAEKLSEDYADFSEREKESKYLALTALEFVGFLDCDDAYEYYYKKGIYPSSLGDSGLHMLMRSPDYLFSTNQNIPLVKNNSSQTQTSINVKPKDQPQNVLSKQQSERLFCTKCGVHLPADAVFCHKCGSKVYKG